MMNNIFFFFPLEILRHRITVPLICLTVPLICLIERTKRISNVRLIEFILRFVGVRCQSVSLRGDSYHLITPPMYNQGNFVSFPGPYLL